jgi:hypothetical protein
MNYLIRSSPFSLWFSDLLNIRLIFILITCNHISFRWPSALNSLDTWFCHSACQLALPDFCRWHLQIWLKCKTLYPNYCFKKEKRKRGYGWVQCLVYVIRNFHWFFSSPVNGLYDIHMSVSLNVLSIANFHCHLGNMKVINSI